MKTAILICGNIRTLDLCKQNILDTFKHLNPDYFAVTTNNKYEYQSYIKEQISFTQEEIVDDVESYYSGFNLIEFRCNINDSDTLKDVVLLVPHYKNTFFQFYNINVGLDMIYNHQNISGITYDCVICIRPDLIFNTIDSFEFSELDDKIYLSTKNVFPNDWCLISTLDNLKKVVSNIVYEFYNKESTYFLERVPHNALEYSIKHNKLEIVHYDIVNYLQRENGHKYY